DEGARRRIGGLGLVGGLSHLQDHADFEVAPSALIGQIHDPIFDRVLGDVGLFLGNDNGLRCIGEAEVPACATADDERNDCCADKRNQTSHVLEVSVLRS